ncbi:GNAT family N-acetyltransferase [Phenylobacterium sp. J367]|uniref:GNAT family N-acetyltransferase n=1 Tax=Phenylobacterium sp. J367 TaxID=2898435 RepID=UPI00215083B3|nr:GNAT family N-acetyltransferase [Phenylobacterium sp. J367]MCR5879061.1 GNAT family N-acetyltransferase [Phenylobacterium sp. J367]
MPEPVIRRAGPQDAETLSEIGARTFSETFAHLYPPEDLQAFLAEAYGLERTRKDLADPAKASWLVEADGEAVGYALAGPCGLPHPEVTAACGELKRFYLLKPWQNGGHGRRLFDEIMAWLQADGPRDIWIGVWSENHGAQRFYGRHGFEKVGEYGFEVGRTVDLEFILRRKGADFSTSARTTQGAQHNFA